MKEFSQAELEALKYYVYCLVDPRDDTIFYVGKGGYNNRVFDHARGAIYSDENNLKLDTIREINDLGLEVKYYILRHGIESEELAYTVESVIIDLLTYPVFNKKFLLTNLVSGHHQWDEGIKTREEIAPLYNCAKLVPMHKLLLVSLNKTYIQKNAQGVYVRVNLYECTRKYWKLNPDRANQVEYVLGVYRGIVRAVIKPTSKWELTSYDDNGMPFTSKRYQIEGIMDDEVGNNLYLNKDVTDYPFGSGGSIRYIS